MTIIMFQERACEDVDYEVCSSSSPESSDEDEEMEEQKRKQLAVVEKEKVRWVL